MPFPSAALPVRAERGERLRAHFLPKDKQPEKSDEEVGSKNSMAAAAAAAAAEEVRA